MAAGRRQVFNPKSIAIAAVCGLLLLVMLWTFGRVQKASYAKLVPLAVELVVKVEKSQNLLLQYDYGYGFNDTHQQLRQLQAMDQPQSLRFSVSSWKKPLALRVVVADADTTSVQSVNLQQADSVVRLLNAGLPDGQPDSVVMLLDDLPALLDGKG